MNAMSEAYQPPNDDSPISRLPDELLIELFRWVYFNTVLWFNREQKITLLDLLKYHAEPEWLVVFGVCRRWRDLLHSTKIFWGVINVYRKPDWLRKCLSLVDGSDVPLYIHFHSDIFPTAELSLLQPHLHFLSALSFKAISDSWRDSLLSIFAHQLGVSSLAITMCDSYGPTLDLGLSLSRLPNLRDLSLCGVLPPNEPPLFAQLHTLHLSDCDWTVTFKEFLSCIRCCVNLQQLTLSDALWQLNSLPDTAQTPREEDYVDLPCLRKITMRHRTTLNARVLAYFRLPVVSEVQVYEDMSWDRDDNIGLLPHTFLGIVSPTHSATIPPALVASIVSLTFQAEKTEHSLRGFTADERPVGALHLAFYTEFEDPWMHDAADTSTRDLVAILRGAPVSSLDLQLHFGKVSPEAFRMMLQTFPKLKSLAMRGRGDYDYVWDILTPGPASPRVDVLDEQSESGEGRSSEDGPLCPDLESIRLGRWVAGYTGDARILDGILRMLQARDACGVRIRTLDIQLMHKTREDYDVLHAAYVPRMEEYVDTVSYEYVKFEEYVLDYDQR